MEYGEVATLYLLSSILQPSATVQILSRFFPYAHRGAASRAVNADVRRRVGSDNSWSRTQNNRRAAPSVPCPALCILHERAAVPNRAPRRTRCPPGPTLRAIRPWIWFSNAARVSL